MDNKGRLIVLEGIDGSGKSTQFALLCDRLEKEKKDFRRVTFPQYSEKSSTLLKMYLNGEFGTDPEAVNAYAAATFFAVDRFASYVCKWGSYYNDGGIIMTDRYTTSNAVHQGAKLEDSEREDFFRWLYDYEFSLLKLPAPSNVIYLDVPVEVSVRQMRHREEETNTKADIHETNTEYLEKCRQCGLSAARFYGWTVINCAPDGKMRTIEDIHEEIYASVTKSLSE